MNINGIPRTPSPRRVELITQTLCSMHALLWCLCTPACCVRNPTLPLELRIQSPRPHRTGSPQPPTTRPQKQLVKITSTYPKGPTYHLRHFSSIRSNLKVTAKVNVDICILWLIRTSSISRQCPPHMHSAKNPSALDIPRIYTAICSQST
ncbi:hypothetical protein DFH27DRAFT_322638 [Peziza echinospora]|nr:hypothetical protein DFH27DRAFT_322638 [Peziza echinospora]